MHVRIARKFRKQTRLDEWCSVVRVSPGWSRLKCSRVVVFLPSQAPMRNLPNRHQRKIPNSWSVSQSVSSSSGTENQTNPTQRRWRRRRRHAQARYLLRRDRDSDSDSAGTGTGGPERRHFVAAAAAAVVKSSLSPVFCKHRHHEWGEKGPISPRFSLGLFLPSTEEEMFWEKLTVPHPRVRRVPRASRRKAGARRFGVRPELQNTLPI